MAAGATARRRPTCSAIIVPWLKPTSASADGGSLRRVQFGIEEGVERRARPVDAAPALVRIAEGQRKPLPPDRRLAAGLRRMRRDERGVRQQRLPGAADVDQVVAVGAVAVQEHDQPLGLAGCAAQAAVRRVHRPRLAGHFVLLSPLAFSIAAGLRRPGLVGDRRAFAPLHHMIVGPQQMRRHAAPRPPRLGDLRQSPWRPAAASGRSAMRAASCTARSPAGQASAWPRQNSR